MIHSYISETSTPTGGFLTITSSIKLESDVYWCKEGMDTIKELSILCVSNSKSTSHPRTMTCNHQPQRKHAYDFDFGNMELIPPEVFKMIFVQMIHVTPHITYQQMYLGELVGMARTITYGSSAQIS